MSRSPLWTIGLLLASMGFGLPLARIIMTDPLLLIPWGIAEVGIVLMIVGKHRHTRELLDDLRRITGAPDA